MIRLILFLTASISLPTAGSDIVLLDCDMQAQKGDDFLFLELDWDKSAEAADVTYYDNTGGPAGTYTNVPVTSSAKSINFQSGIAVIKGQPDQFIEVQVNRVDMSFSGGISTPLWRTSMGGNLIDVNGRCRKAERQLEQAF